MPPTPSPGPRYAAQDDLYTVLLIVASSLLFIGIVYICVRTTMLFGSLFPPAGG
jgi:hypothetical protein